MEPIKMKNYRPVIIGILLIVVATFCVAGYYLVPTKRILLQIYRDRFGNYEAKNIHTDNKNRNCVWGIDISHHQKSVNWKVLTEKNRPDFIFLKSTEGSSHTDSKYREYYKKAKEYQIPVGAYHFFSYQTDGKSQAANFIRHAQLHQGDIYPVLDVEFRKNMKDKKWIIKQIKSFCHEIKKEYGVYPIIYCEKDYINRYLGDDFKEFHFWISDLYRKPRCNYAIWQYTDRVFVHGIGKVDNNRLNEDISLEELKL